MGRLGMMMGSSSVEESSSSDEFHCRFRTMGWMLCLFRRLEAVVSSSTTSVVSTLALPSASMVNLAWVLVRGPSLSGIEDRLDSRW